MAFLFAAVTSCLTRYVILIYIDKISQFFGKCKFRHGQCVLCGHVRTQGVFAVEPLRPTSKTYHTLNQFNCGSACSVPRPTESPQESYRMRRAHPAESRATAPKRTASFHQARIPYSCCERFQVVSPLPNRGSTCHSPDYDHLEGSPCC
jgi:hypothetical protein